MSLFDEEKLTSELKGNTLSLLGYPEFEGWCNRCEGTSEAARFF